MYGMECETLKCCEWQHMAACTCNMTCEANRITSSLTSPADENVVAPDWQSSMRLCAETWLKEDEPRRLLTYQHHLLIDLTA